MNIRLLCNAGFEIECDDGVLYVDSPNAVSHPFYSLPDGIWSEICNHPRVRGFCFTHNHPDHYDQERLCSYIKSNPQTPVFLPNDQTGQGIVQMGAYTIEYCNIEHAPIPMAPPHASLLVSVEGKRIYFSGDSILDAERHRDFLNGRKVDIAIWTPMYLSYPATRDLMNDVANKNYICHMPPKAHGAEYWKKCEKNMLRYSDDLRSVQVLENYPSDIVF